jgi:hypothetical protein
VFELAKLRKKKKKEKKKIELGLFQGQKIGVFVRLWVLACCVL